MAREVGVEVAAQNRLQHDTRMELHSEPAVSDRQRKLVFRQERYLNSRLMHEILGTFPSDDKKSMKPVAHAPDIDPRGSEVIDGKGDEAGLFEQFAATCLDWRLAVIDHA